MRLSDFVPLKFRIYAMAAGIQPIAKPVQGAFFANGGKMYALSAGLSHNRSA